MHLNSGRMLEDTDGDGLTDWQEVLCKDGLITGNSTDGFVLPTYEEYLKIAVSIEELEGIEDFLRNKLDSSSYQYVKNIKVLPLISDPTVEDTDGEKLLDGEEYEYDLFDGVTIENLGLVINTSPLYVDTDRDGINDYYDDYPTEYNATGTVYNRQAAIEYAYKWYQCDENNNHNPDFYYHSPNCTNFASQCINAGGFETNDDWNCYYFGKYNGFYDFIEKYDKIKDYYIQKVLLCLNGYHTDESGWIWTSSWIRSNNLLDWLTSEQCPYTVSKHTILKSNFDYDINNIIDSNNIREGDLLFFCYNLELSDMCPDHTAVVGKVDKINSEITFVQHGNAIHEKLLTFDILNGDVNYEQVIVIHMEPEFRK